MRVQKIKIAAWERMFFPSSSVIRKLFYPAAFLLFLILAAAGNSFGAGYYVNPAAGSDSYDGSKTRPWKTLYKAKTTAVAGDTVNLLPGNYGSAAFGAAGDHCGTSWSAPIIYQSDPASTPYCAKFSFVYFTGGRNMYIKVIGFDVENAGYGDSCIKTEKTSNVIISDCKAHGQAGGIGASYADIFVKSSNFVTVEDCEVYYGGIWAFGIQLEDSNSVTARRCHVHDVISSGIRTGGGSDYLIENNVIHDQRTEWNADVHGCGIAIHTNYTTVRGNIIYNYGNTRSIRFYQDLMGAQGYHNMLIENNLVYKTSDFTGVQWWPEFLDVGDNCVIRNNTFIDSCVIIFAQNADGSGLSIYNNIISGNLELDDFGATNTGTASTKWNYVHEGGNVYGGVVSRGCGYQCNVDRFNAGSDSLVGVNCTVGSVFKSGAADYPYTNGYPYRLIAGSSAIGQADAANSPSIDLLGQARSAANPDAGCYVYGGSGSGGSTLQGYWMLDEGSGRTVSDSSTNRNAGTLVNNAAWSASGDLTFDGVSSYVNCGPDKSLNITSSLSVCAWINPHSFGQSDNVRIVDRGNGSNGFSFYIDKATAALSFISYGVKSIKSNSNVVGLNRWQHAAVVFNSAAGTVTFYLDGQSVGSSAFASAPLDSGTAPLLIGIRGYDLTRPFDGTMCGVRVYSEALTAVNVAKCADTDDPFPILPIGDKMVAEGSILTFQVSTRDPAAPVTLTSHNLPSQPTFSGKSFTWTPAYGTAGTYSAVFSTVSGGTTYSETIKITVIATAPPKKLVGYWKFDEGSGTFAKDSSGNGNNGTVYASLWTTGKVGSAVLLNGQTGYVVCGSGASLNLKDSLTISAWINPQSLGQFTRIVDKGIDGQGYSFYADSTNDSLCYAANGQTSVKSAGSAVSLNKWQHVAVVYDETAHLVTFYVNGRLFDSVAYSTSPSDSGTVPLYIGIRGYDLARAFDGSIDEVRVYNYALCPSDIAAIYACANSTIIDNDAAGTSYTGTWSASSASGCYGVNSLWSRDGDTYTWTFSCKTSGYYQVSMWWTAWSSRSTYIPVKIANANGTATAYINQQLNGGKWNLLGEYYFNAGTSYGIKIISQPGPSSTCADAVKITPH